MEVGGGEGDAVLDDTGKADGDAVEGGQEGMELIEAPEHDQGVGTVGVGTRCRSLTGLPAGSSSMALRPEPPMSMARVMGPTGFLGSAWWTWGQRILRVWESSGEL